MRDLLLIIDMQKVYEDGQPWCCPAFNQVRDNIITLLTADTPPDLVAFTRYVAPTHPVGTWKNYNQKYTDINNAAELSELTEVLKPYATLSRVYNKSTYSALGVPALQAMLKLNRIDRIIITGVVAQCCVLSTVMGLIDTGIPIIYLKDAVAGQSADFEEMTTAVIQSFAPIHTSIMTTAEYRQTL